MTIIENQSFDKGLQLDNKADLVIRNCQITHRDGSFGLSLTRCQNIRIEDCTIRRIGNEAMVEKSLKIVEGYEFSPTNVAALKIDRSKNIVVARNDITDSFGKGIYVSAELWHETSDILIEGNRIAYIYDDAIYFSTKNDQSPPKPALPLRGAILRNNTIHDIGLGLSQLPFARHGMYLKVRDVLVEGNTISNCFFGEGISLRNAGVIRNNKVRNCARACITYWAQTDTSGSSGVVQIEGNECRQDFSLPLPMRHIDFPAKQLHHLPLGAMVLAHSDNSYAQITKFIIRDNQLRMGADYADNAAMIAGSGDPTKTKATFELVHNQLTDLRGKPSFFSRLPVNTDTTKNTLRTT